MSELHDAVRDEMEVQVYWLLEQGADVNATDANGQTPLMLAARSNLDIHAVEALLGHGAQINVRDRLGNTPLTLALDFSKYDVVHAFLAQPPSAGLTDETSDSRMVPLVLSFFLAVYQDDLLRVEQILNSREVSVDAQNAYGDTPLSLAARLGRTQIVSILLGAGANPNVIPNSSGASSDTPLHLAVEDGYIEVTSQLLQHNALVDPRDELGRTPLMCAKTIGLVELLLKFGANAEAVDANGDSSLVYAAYSAEPDVVELLLHTTPIPSQEQKQRAFRRASEYSRSDVEALLTKNGVIVGLTEAVLLQDIDLVRQLLPNSTAEETNRALIDAVEHSTVEIVQDLLRAGADTHFSSPTGSTSLMRVFWRWYDVEILVELLLRAGAEVNSQDNEGQSPLLIAPVNEHEKAMVRLINNGANVNAQNRRGDTALLKASRTGDLAVVELLLRHGCRVDLTNTLGRTALLEATNWGHTEIVRSLVVAGADTTRSDLKGRTPLSLAKRWPGKNIEALLLG
jgi:ankyrin repeat protein